MLRDVYCAVGNDVITQCNVRERDRAEEDSALVETNIRRERVFLVRGNHSLDVRYVHISLRGGTTKNRQPGKKWISWTRWDNRGRREKFLRILLSYLPPPPHLFSVNVLVDVHGHHVGYKGCFSVETRGQTHRFVQTDKSLVYIAKLLRRVLVSRCLMALLACYG
ncbi:uncharacterized protein LOC143146121 [Ptiloglossa arizonensis]|uniref:uncharacterized protein LOC143146121 n=1 Tax=Ptiloglossa arizonensis TaxID=3350558 RepID=UPI003FA01AA9